MGMLLDGQWIEQDQIVKQGEFVRSQSFFSEPLSEMVIKAIQTTPENYLLIGSVSCPWSHRTIILRQLKEHIQHIPIHLAGGRRVQGYSLNNGRPWVIPGSDQSIIHLHQLYSLSSPAYTGRVTVPVLWDSRQQCIISNDSANIMKGLDLIRSSHHQLDFTLRPQALRAEIDELNNSIYSELNNAVYQAGFAQTQNAYDEAVAAVFRTLDELEKRLKHQRYLFDLCLTESDWYLFPTLVRFDSVYYCLHRCSQRRLVDYPNLWAYARDLYAWRGIKNTVDSDVIRQASYQNDTRNNPFSIVAVAPDCDWSQKHGRESIDIAKIALRSGEIIEVDPTTLKATQT